MSWRPENQSRSKGSPSPFSLRLTFEERAALEEAADDKPLGAYIRSQALQGKETRRRKKRRRPVKDHRALGYVLGELGRSRLASNVNQLAHAVNSGSLPVTPDTEKALQDACADIHKMRIMLMRALDFIPNEGSS
ncbi:MAG: hypothetical protein KZQ96_22415 [Candidatus Thiodiazotropha sp. (ex Lucinoma borealis)]|nr:hypothetical protein [Candidatus Thiodiazotropha sp. (ex Lucinoma borealis)]